MKINDGFKVFFIFGADEVWKMVFENVWEPCKKPWLGQDIHNFSWKILF